MIDFIETHVEFILEFLHVLFPSMGNPFWPRNSAHPVTLAYFLTIVVIQNVSLLMAESSMATGSDVAESDVTGSDVIRSKVGDSPWGVILLFSRNTTVRTQG
jgi:hypothetical protein